MSNYVEEKGVRKKKRSPDLLCWSLIYPAPLHVRLYSLDGGPKSNDSKKPGVLPLYCSIVAEIGERNVRYRSKGKGGARPPPFIISTIMYKVVMYAPAERENTLPLFLLYPFLYSVVWTQREDEKEEWEQREDEESRSTQDRKEGARQKKSRSWKKTCRSLQWDQSPYF